MKNVLSLISFKTPSINLIKYCIYDNGRGKDGDFWAFETGD